MAPGTEKKNLGAYAAYMIATIHAKRGETGTAQATIAKMEEAYPGGTTQHAFVEMANAYLVALARGDEAAACESVARRLRARTPNRSLSRSGRGLSAMRTKIFSPRTCARR